jgi:hypothetical protein
MWRNRLCSSAGVRSGEFDEFEAVDAQGVVLNFGHFIPPDERLWGQA